LKVNGYLTAKVIRFFGWWIGLSSLFGAVTVCPFCGRSSCPVGAGTAGLTGGIFTLCLQNWKYMIKHIFRRKIIGEKHGR